VKVSMPEGASFGWGIAGENLRQELSRLPPIDGVTLHCIARHDFEPRNPNDWNAINIGYCFFEHDILAYHSLPHAYQKWDFIAAGSRWCEYHLRIAGARRTTTILQGIDPNLFSYQPPRREDGRFIVFSGGKFEYRKGHDIVIAAMRIFMEKHPDVWFSCAWHNLWDQSIKTMDQSRLISFTNRDIPCEELYRETLQANGIDMTRVLLHPLHDNKNMAGIYSNSNIGLFPNRCEGGNNMVMCEYMACGRPVVAATLTGHADVITASNSYGLTKYAPTVFYLNGMATGVWFESSVDEAVSLLERAYCNRDLTLSKGVSAAAEMQRLSWKDVALKFHAIAAHLARNRRTSLERTTGEILEAAEQHFNAGRFTEAEKEYLLLVRRTPLNAELYNCLGTVLDRQERFNEAVAYYTKAIALRPDLVVARYNLANTFKRLGRTAECSMALQQIVESEPDSVDAWQNLGVCMYEEKNFARAAECFEQVIALDPNRSGSYASLGEIYYQLGTNLERGIECLDRALEKQPGLVELLNLKGLMYHELEQFELAGECYREGLELEPRNSFILSNIGNMYLAMAMPEKAILYFNLALEIEPGNASIIFNRAMARLQGGDYLRGWEDYELRFQKKEPVVIPALDIPVWNGEPITGKTLLVRSEQVYGDSIQFIRYLPLLRRFNVSVVFECLDTNIRPLFENAAGIDLLVVRGESYPAPLFQVPLASLPRILGTTCDTIPFSEGYLVPDPIRRREWSDKLNMLCSSSSKKVGIVWGGRKPRLNSNRSLQLSSLAPLFTLSNITWFSLQTGDDRSQLAENNFSIIDLGASLRNFADSAALIAELDLVITIDTAIAHLVGALGVPVWVMLKSSPDWRWMLDRDDSPWYDSARLFRQPEPGDWESVIAAIKLALGNL